MSDYDEPWQCLELVVQCLLSRVDNIDLLCMLEDLDINSLDDIRSISEADLFESIECFGFDSMCSTNLIARFHLRVLRRVSLLLQYERYPMPLREWREVASQSFVDWNLVIMFMVHDQHVSLLEITIYGMTFRYCRTFSEGVSQTAILYCRFTTEFPCSTLCSFANQKTLLIVLSHCTGGTK